MAADRASLVLPSDPSFTVAADAGRQDELPPGVWREVLRQLSVQQRFVVSMVCKAWRGHALSLLIPELEVCLNSGAAAFGLGRWLCVHGAQLHTLTLTEHFFDHHGQPPAAAAAAAVLVAPSRLGPIARVKLWQGLHGGSRPLKGLHTLKVRLDDISAADAVAIGLCAMPALTHLTLESNASAIGVTGAVGLVTLTSLRELVVPSQAIGDQGLQFICNALVHLQALNVHNDGHVTDDGLAALAGLTGLTYLDLQGNVSITQAAMPTLASAAPHLVSLNLSWLAMVNDWGLRQLAPLSRLQELNLRATGVQLARHNCSGLDLLSRLTSLDLSRCRIEADAIELLATSATSLRDLSLAETSGMTSFTDLLPLQQLSRLTKLDLSSPASSLRLPTGDIIAVCELTQLRHLVLNEVVSQWRPDYLQHWLQPAGLGGSTALRMLDLDSAADNIRRDLHAAAAPIIAALQHPTTKRADIKPGRTTAAAGAEPNDARADAAPSGVQSSSQQQPQGVTEWGQLLMQLPRLTRLTTLEFSKNASAWAPLAPHPSAAVHQEPAAHQTAVQLAVQLVEQQAAVHDGAVQPTAVQRQRRSPMQPQNVEAALLLLAFAAAHQTVLTTLVLHAPKAVLAANRGAAVRPFEQQVGVLRGQWGAGLVEVVAEMLQAIGGCQQGPQVLQQQQKQQQGDQQQQQQQQEEEKEVGQDRQQAMGKPSASDTNDDSRSGCRLQPAAAEQLQALACRVHIGQQQQQQMVLEGQAEGEVTVTGHPVSPSLSRADAAEVLRLLLPGLQRLDLNW